MYWLCFLKYLGSSVILEEFDDEESKEKMLEFMFLEYCKDGWVGYVIYVWSLLRMIKLVYLWYKYCVLIFVIWIFIF